jgi:hypothetical protein
LDVREFLDEQLDRTLIGHRGLTSLPPRSPDLSPLKFFFWVFVKDYVYTPSMPQSLADLQGQISDVTAQVTAMIQRTQEEFQYCADVCHITCGAHTEHLQIKLEAFLYMYQIISLS